MPIPTHEDAMLPVLAVLAGGGVLHRRALADAMADHFQLTAEERSRVLPSGKSRVIGSRTGWALSYMKQAGLVRTTRRGWYEITDEGREALATNPVRIDNDFLEQFDGFREFRTRSRDTTAGANGGEVEREGTPAGQAPDEALEDAYNRLRAAVEVELLDALKAATPAYFEQVVIDLLVKMGYGGSRAEAARAIGRSGDGGVDGVIDEDRLGLDVIYVQAKRWEGTVSRPEIQKFAGALQGQRATKGVFLTTSSYTREAVEFAEKIGTRIILIDGHRLASLMFEYDIGVAPKNTYTVKTLDGDYFEEA